MGHPINRGLAFSYPLSETGGLIARELVSNRNPGALTNYTTRTTAAGPKQTGTALSFNGSNQYVNCGATSYTSLPGEMTFAAWIYLTSVSGISFGNPIAGNLDSAPNFCQWSFEANRTAARLDVLANLSTIAVTSNTNLVANQWYFVAFTRAGVAGSWTYTIYLNGIPDGSAGTAQNPDANQTTAIGQAGAWALRYFPGSISGARAWRRPLTQSELGLLNARPMTGLLAPRRRIISQSGTVAYRPRLIRWAA
jgi:hypothetical protein